MIEGDVPSSAASMAAAAAPEPSVASRLASTVGGGLVNAASIPFLIPNWIAATTRAGIEAQPLAVQGMRQELEASRLANEQARRQAALSEAQLPVQTAAAQAALRQQSALDERIAGATDPRLRESLIRGAAGGPFQPFEIEPTDLEKATYSTVLGIGADEASQMLRQKNALELARKQNEYQLGQIGAQGVEQRKTLAAKGPEPIGMGDVAGLRKEYTALSKDFGIVRDAAKKIQAVANQPSAAGDLSLVFNFMKLLDPGSSVRESEQASARNAAGVPERIRNTWNRVLTGENLTPEQRADFLAQAGNVFDSHLSTQLEQEGKFADLATRWGAKPEDVVDIGVVPKELRGGLKTKERKTINGAEYERVPGGWKLVK